MIWFETAGNAVQLNQTKVILLSSIYNGKHGTFLYPLNIRQGITLFCSRSLIPQDWIKDQDRYIGRETYK
jgi:hypothetical protein